MKVQAGQRWRWVTDLGKSDVILEIESVNNGYAKCRYIQVFKKGYPQDVVGQLDTISTSTIEYYTEKYTYLE